MRKNQQALFKILVTFLRKIYISSTEYGKKIFFYKKIKTKLNLLTITERGQRINRTTEHFRELSSGVLKLLHALLLTFYTK